MRENCQNKIVKILLIPLLAIIILWAFPKTFANAVTSSTVNFQGKIVRNDAGYEGLNVTAGNPSCVVDGANNDTCDFKASYYTSSTSGTLLLTETFSDVEIGMYGGVFDLSLGSGSVTTSSQCRDGTCNSLEEVLSEFGDIYVEIQFAPNGSTFTETFSRMPLQASAYSIYSKYSGGASDAFQFSNSLSSTTTSSPNAGMVYYDSSAGALRMYDGSTWQALATGGSSVWGTDDISTFSWSQFMETTGIAQGGHFSVDSDENRASIWGASVRSGLSVYSNYNSSTDWPVLAVKADGANFNAPILRLDQDGTGDLIAAYRGTNNRVFRVDNSGDVHLGSDGVLYMFPYSATPTNLSPNLGEGCMYNVNGHLFWSYNCDAAYGVDIGSPSSGSLWTDAGTFTYLTGTSDDVVLGASTIADATFVFDVDASGGNYFEVDNSDNSSRLFTIDSNGNVGIGTASPSAKLDIGGVDSIISNTTGPITVRPADGNLRLEGNGSNYTNSRLTFGDSSYVYIEEYGGYDSDAMSIHGDWGVEVVSDNSDVNVYGNRISLNDHVYVDVDSNTSLYAVKNGHNTSGDIFASRTEVNQTVGGALTAFGYRTIARATHTSGSLSGLQANSTQLQFEGSGGTTSYAEGVTSNATVSSGAIVSNLSMMRVYSPSNSGTIGNLKGLYIQNMSAGSTSNYSIYSEGGTMYHAGNIGIGDASPAYMLSILGTTNSTSAYANVMQKWTVPGIIGVKNANTGAIAIGTFETGINGRSRMDFLLTGNPSSGNNWGSIADTTVMTLLGNGNVGVGTTNPTRNFEVVGTAYISSTLTLNGTLAANAGLSQDGNTILNGSDTWLRTTGTTGWYSTTYQGGVYMSDFSYVRIYNNKGFISNGNVGIGTTPTYYKLQVNGEIASDYANAFRLRQGSRSVILRNDGGTFYFLLTDTLDGSWNNYRPMAINLSSGSVDFTYDSIAGSNYRVKFHNTYTGANKRNLLISLGTSATLATSDYYVVFSDDGPGGFHGSISGDGGSGIRYNTSSDARMKTDIQDFTDGLDKVMQIQPRTFEWKSTPGVTDVGFIAQELYAIYPYAVSGTPDGDVNVSPMMVDYSQLTPLLVSAVKDLNNKVDAKFADVYATLSLLPKDTGVTIGSDGWYRIAQTTDGNASADIKLIDNTVGSYQSMEFTVVNNSINISNNVTGSKQVFSNFRFVTQNGTTYLEVYLEGINNDKVLAYLFNSNGWSRTDWVKSTYTGNTEVYAVKGVSFNIDKTLSVQDNHIKLAGNLLTDNSSDIGSQNSRWNNIYASGMIKLGGDGSEGSIRYNVDKHRLEFTNDGKSWVPMGDLKSQNVLSPEYSGAVLYADGSDNSGMMTSDSDDSNNQFLNYYQWTSDRPTLQDYDILVRVTLPSDFMSWNEEGISLDYVTENSASTDNNKVDMYLYSQDGSTQTPDAQSENNISKLAGQWQRVSLSGNDINQCNKAGQTCVIKLKLSSKDNYYVRVGDITLNYNRSL